ncbi:hypothetical protein CA85_26370 [Allorhodopirellula solitaria]|uniref:Uncharacterized protein n=1 Tax=Allorhodopirellula solitaria TaxID=2527987 RepID=A0A5C5XUG0_9BACT|nr:hypothetical protein CA85_26370 [Allorhodopirellula solitaria]
MPKATAATLERSYSGASQLFVFHFGLGVVFERWTVRVVVHWNELSLRASNGSRLETPTPAIPPTTPDASMASKPTQWNTRGINQMVNCKQTKAAKSENTANNAVP